MTKFSVVRKMEIEKTLLQHPRPGKRVLEPFKTLAETHNLPLKILEDTEVKNEAEVHKREGDLWFCLEGEVSFRCGGELTNPNFRQYEDGSWNEDESFALDIHGGEEIVLNPGDWLWIPPGVAHQHHTSKTARLIIIKIPERQKA